MTEGGQDVVCATVTYGDRGHLCSAVVNRALESGARRIIVIAQDVSIRAAEALRQMEARDSRVNILWFDNNPGSAEGFSRALDALESAEERYALLLDDDNVLRNDLTDLVRQHDEIAANTTGAVVVFAHRDKNVAQARALAGVRRPFPGPGSFMSFDVIGRVLRLLPKKPTSLAAVPYGPYGGLFARVSTLSRAHRPRLDFGLYEDDTYFTYGLLKSGATLVVTARTRVNDIDGKWSDQSDGSKGGLRSLLLAQDTQRRHLAIRNRVTFDRERAGVRMLAAYWLNKSVYCFLLWLTAVRLGATSDVLEFRKAASAGERRAARRKEGRVRGRRTLGKDDR